MLSPRKAVASPFLPATVHSSKRAGAPLGREASLTHHHKHSPAQQLLLQVPLTPWTSQSKPGLGAVRRPETLRVALGGWASEMTRGLLCS